MLWGGLSSLLSGVPRRVVASHSTGRMNGGKNFKGTDRFFLASADAVVALSELHAEYLERQEGIDPGKIRIIENGIDVERYATPPAQGTSAALRDDIGVGRDDHVVMMVAALRPEKAHEALLSAARSIVASRQGVKFLIVGDGDRRAELERMRNDLELGEHVLFLGVRSDIPQLLAIADTVVLPSHPAVETLPMAVLEAMAAGVPVVASAVGSIPDLIEHKRNGLLIQPADANGLRGAICYIIDNKEESRSLAEAARATVREKYTIEQMVSSYAALFERLANSPVQSQ
jgi:glycosyltransferase involved in cell wall biosynthesis